MQRSLMIFRKASPQLAGAAALLLCQACVQYLPEQQYASAPAAPPPPPAPPPAAYAGPVPTPPQAPPPVPAAPASNALDPVLAPIALYPDPLIALILPASTVPGDISAAAAYQVQYGDTTRIDGQPWDPSVRALAHYPTVISWMADNMAWTQALGSAFSASPGEVMDSIQSLRARALAAGTLQSTPQVQVITDDDSIEILPAQPDAVYVPAYDPQVVYSEEPYYNYGGPFINYGEPYPEGVWLSFGFDWHHHRVWQGYNQSWHDHGGWRPPGGADDRPPQGGHPWAPKPGPGRALPPIHTRPGSPNPTPRLMPGVPNPPPEHYKKPSLQPNPQGSTRNPVEPARAAPQQGAVKTPAQPASQLAEAPRRPPESGQRYSAQPTAPAPSAARQAAPAQARPAAETQGRGTAPSQGSPARGTPGQSAAHAAASPHVSAPQSAPAAAPAAAAAAAPASNGNNTPQK